MDPVHRRRFLGSAAGAAAGIGAVGLLAQVSRGDDTDGKAVPRRRMLMRTGEGRLSEDEKKYLAEQYTKSLEAVEKAYEKSNEECMHALFRALADRRVFQLWEDRLDDNYFFLGTRCHEIHGEPDQKGVVFDFEESWGSVYPGDFLVLVDVENGEVIKIVEPYIDTPPSLTLGGCSGSGSVDADVRISGGRLVVKVKAKAKVKCFGQTVLSASGSVTLSKRLTELSPCVDVDVSAGLFRVDGRLCLYPARACLEDATVYVKYKGSKYKIGTISSACVPI